MGPDTTNKGKKKMSDSDSLVLEMLRDDIKRFGDKIESLDDRVRKEIDVNNQRHLAMTISHGSMRSDIRLVSAKVAVVVSAALFSLSMLLKKMGLY